MTWPDEPSSESSWPPLARETSQDIGEPHRLEPGGFYVVNTANGIRNIDLTKMTPGRHPVFSDVRSFAHYLKKHAAGDIDIFADEESSRIVAVLDAYSGGLRWQEHTVTLPIAPGALFMAIVQTVIDETGADVMFGTPGA